MKFRTLSVCLAGPALTLALAAAPGLAQESKTPPPERPRREAPPDPAQLRAELKELRVKAEHLRMLAKEAAAAGDFAKADADAKEAKALGRRVQMLERRLPGDGGEPDIGAMRRRAEELQAKIRKAQESGNQEVVARLEKELAGVHSRIERAEKGGEAGREKPPSPEEREKLRAKNVVRMEKQAETMRVRAKDLESAGQMDRAADLRKRADELAMRADKIRKGEVGEPVVGEGIPGRGQRPPGFRGGEGRGPGSIPPQMRPEEIWQLRAEIESIKKELREIRELLKNLSPERPKKAERPGRKGQKRGPK